MDIDKVYRLAGGALKRIWKLYISKPFRDYNVENRAQKAISKEKPEPAQWHDSTREAFKEAKKFTDSSFQQYNKFDEKLADRLKSVRVLSKDEEIEIEANKDKDKSRYPADRLVMAMPYVFQKPEFVPPGKITVYDALDMLLDWRNNKTPAEELAKRYRLSLEDLQKVLQSVDVFMAVKKEQQPTNMTFIDEKLLEESGAVDFYDSVNDPKKLKEREVLMKRSVSKIEAGKSKEPPQAEQQQQKVVSKVDSNSS